ncbi:MAG: SGNH/GDSL hydrolase family protein [Clostridia bacterium]|nr:SGNH/GDSL hydrolase family protein [Clostridia bacterium]
MPKRILFQGDSITDCGRDRNNFYGMGGGYPNLVKAALGMDCPNEYEFINRGISGDRIVDVYARIKRDFINLKPDYASILIGVNDTWHEVNIENGVDTEKFENIYSMLLDEIFEALPDLKLFLIAPYVLEGDGTCNTEENPNKWEFFKADVESKAEAVKRLAKKYNLPIIELQPEFDKACEKAPNNYWAYDGVHPTACGHELIKRAWLKQFNEIK